MSRVPLFQKKRVMEGRRRKYTPPGSEYDIPTRTRRLRQSSIRKLQSEANFSFVVTPYLEHQLKMSYILTQQNLDQDSSDHNTDSGSEDTHDDGGGGMTNLDQDSFDNRSENAHNGDDITNLHADPESDELPPHLSQTTESSVFSLEDSVDFGVFQPLWQSYTDSESFGSGEEFPMEDSADKSANEQLHFGVVGFNERVPPVNDEPLYTGSRLTNAQSFLLILSNALRHSLTGVALSDLLDLINIHCPENVLTSKHLFLKELKPIQGHLECHIYCPNCEYYIGNQVTEGQCCVCNSTWDRNSSLKNLNFFLYLPIQTQLEHLLQREDIACWVKSGNGTCTGPSQNISIL
ncbi:uncharacterized protein LOC124879195 isoform X1 [Girardinichthys multiradiatus]|uniref:uncharacterized protein LOC124879195 isoform X1 n=1 Tax=Girardinichthys multiradiatus TaxID=208333 RepID=UPI001FAD4194|nr:uncharacterized protein LOC124879195 isoform X1 [Girardinichthys multiradiatus]